MSKQASVHLRGGIGNQLYMIASLLGYCKKNGVKPVYVKSETSLIREGENLLEKFPQLQEMIPEGILDNPIKYMEVIGSDIPKFQDRDVILYGYFQEEKYFIDIKDEIIELFRSCLVITKPLENTVGIHIRRGDYLQLSHIFHNYEADYFKYCLDFFPSSELAIVSIDTDYVDKNFTHSQYPNIIKMSADPFTDISTLISCSNGVIIGNSTFGWWSSYLNVSSNKKIFYPTEWIKDTEKRNYSVDGWIVIDYFKKSKYQLDIDIAINCFKDGNKLDIFNCIKERVPHIDKYLFNCYFEMLDFPKNFRICQTHEEILQKIIEIQTRYVIVMTQQQRQKLLDIFGDGAETVIDFTKIPMIVIARLERRSIILDRFKEHNITPIWSDPVCHNNKVMGCGLAHYQAVKLGLKMGAPFCIFEDDIKFTEHFKSVLTLPIGCDAFYLGLSSWGLRGINFSVEDHYIEAYQDVMGFAKITNMLAAHGILIINPNWGKKLKHIYKSSKYYMIPQDVGSAGFQKYSNVLAPIYSYMYQDKELNGQEIGTNINLHRYII